MSENKEAGKAVIRYWDYMAMVRKMLGELTKASDLDQTFRLCGTFSKKATKADGIMVIRQPDNRLQREIAYSEPVPGAYDQKSLLGCEMVQAVFGGNSLIRRFATPQDRSAAGVEGIPAFALLAVPIRSGPVPFGAILAWKSGAGASFESDLLPILQDCALLTASSIEIASAAQVKASQDTLVVLASEAASRIADPLVLMSVWLKDMKAKLGADRVRELASYFKKFDEQLAEIDKAVVQWFYMASRHPEEGKEHVLVSKFVEDLVLEFPHTLANRIAVKSPGAGASATAWINRDPLHFALREIFLCTCSLSRGKLRVGIRDAGDAPFSTIEILSKAPGAGIAREDKKHLFDPTFFLSALRRETHMSLNLAHDLIRRQGGSLEEGGRTPDEILFRIGLPKKNQAESSAAADPGEPSGGIG